jgi:hypothetical protein
LSDGGRLFFNSDDALVPQDTNGTEDVYEYEPAGVGTCTTTSATYHEKSGGCVDLVSSGIGAEESAFMDASESGEDVFFMTPSELTREDVDDAYDVYDAHACTSASPCPSQTLTAPPCTTADSCRVAPAPQPAIFGAPASATFSGVGNLAPASANAKPQPKTKAKRAKAKKRAKKRESKAHARKGKRGRHSGGGQSKKSKSTSLSARTRR